MFAIPKKKMWESQDRHHGVVKSLFVEIVTQQTLAMLKTFRNKNITDRNLFLLVNSNLEYLRISQKIYL